MPWHFLGIAALLLSVTLLGCGGSAASEEPRAAGPVTVYAASSLRDALPRIAPKQRYNFASSGTLQTQIDRGAPADVFASASPQETQALYRAGLCSRPVTFAGNDVVMMVPKGNPADLGSVQDLRAGTRRVAVGAVGVPAGDYTRELLARMRLSSILATNTVSLEADAAGIASKVALGSVDAGFAYRTDARIVADRVDVIGLPGWAQPPIRYEVCVVRGDGVDSAGAQGFVDDLTGPKGSAVLKANGFGPAPR